MAALSKLWPFSPDGAMIAGGTATGSINSWDANTGQLLRSLEGHSGGINDLRFNATCNLLRSAADSTVRLWNPSSRTVLQYENSALGRYMPRSKTIVQNPHSD